MVAARELRELGAVMMPVPRCISASCGVALRLEPQALPDARERLESLFPQREGWRLYLIQGQQAQPLE